MHVDMACQLCQSRRSPPFIRKDFTGAFQPSGAFARGLQSVFGGRIQQFLKPAFDSQRRGGVPCTQFAPQTRGTNERRPRQLHSRGWQWPQGLRLLPDSGGHRHGKKQAVQPTETVTVGRAGRVDDQCARTAHHRHAACAAEIVASQQQQEMGIVMGVQRDLVLGHRWLELGQRQRTHVALLAIVAKKAPVGEGLRNSRHRTGHVGR